VFFAHDGLVGSQQNIEIASPQVHDQSLSFFFRTIKSKKSHCWEPFFDLLPPLTKRNLWHDDNVVGPPIEDLLLGLLRLDLGKNSDRLDRFP